MAVLAARRKGDGAHDANALIETMEMPSPLRMGSLGGRSAGSSPATRSPLHEAADTRGEVDIVEASARNGHPARVVL